MTDDKQDWDRIEQAGELGRGIARAGRAAETSARELEEDRRKAREAAAFIVETRKIADAAKRAAADGKQERDYIAEAILAAILFAIWVPVWGLPENVKTWVSLAGLAVLLVLILRKRIIAPAFRKILHRPWPGRAVNGRPAPGPTRRSRSR